MQNFKRDGRTITYRNKSTDDISGGDLLVLADMVGVATRDITAGASGALSVEGVYKLPKEGGAVKQGQRVYAAGSGGAVTAAVGTVPVGIAWAEAGAGEKFVLVKINV